MAENGELQNTQAGANIRTTRLFGDFKLHIEYNCPRGGNSGVYLRGRYEVQVEYEPAGKNDSYHSMGSIYGSIPPAATVDARPGQWESYDVTLEGRNVSVIRDGMLIIDHAEIPGITGGALDSHGRRAGTNLPARGPHRRIEVSQHHDLRARALKRLPYCSTVRATGCSIMDALLAVRKARW